ncbi:CRISPR-associated protein Cas4 [Clostridium prolinivorans]|uniref:CRISPR-associated protein Cas4 n=1 Tax=Clostridium prolinivorans TaxID=2769420 RepID=UPI000FDA2D33|nr:CRISPR-associated protein Cas4 [Clostridium prolinivorans]
MENIFGEHIKITGTQINYLLICKKKLWFFLHGITMEQNSDKVALGKEIHNNSLTSKRSEILIDNSIRIDYIDNELTVHEIKSTKAMKEASKVQILYYIYYLQQKGIDCRKGIIHYPNLKKTEIINYTDEDKCSIEKFMNQIVEISNMEFPPQKVKEKKCKSCSYYELCFC